MVGVDGAAAMLAIGRQAVAAAGLVARIRLTHVRLPAANLPGPRYDAVISNSLLHHLADPAVLWETVRTAAAPGAAVFVMDLMRPPSRDAAEDLVALHAADAPDVLRRDFFNSLLAAFRPDEVRLQLSAAGLSDVRVEIASDRHLIAYGHV
jgi:SAM-dependent methyltransferase